MKEKKENKAILLDLVRISCLVIGVPLIGLALSSGSLGIATALLYLFIGGILFYAYKEWKAGTSIRRLGVGLFIELALASIFIAIATPSVPFSAAILVLVVIFIGCALFLFAKPYLK